MNENTTSVPLPADGEAFVITEQHTRKFARVIATRVLATAAVAGAAYLLAKKFDAKTVLDAATPQ